MKGVSGGLKGELSQFRELQAFAQFGTSDLDAATRRQLDRGQRATELLKQPQFEPLSMAEESVVLYALNRGLLDDVPVAKVPGFEDGLRKFLASNHPDLLRDVTSSPVMNDDVDGRMRSIISQFKETVPY
jgi:F-type H+-transporting ATPase subunit alpha